MTSVHAGDPSAEPEAQTVDDSSPSSGLSGSTLKNESPPSERHEIDSLLRTAEEPSLNMHRQHYALSPTAYYDDLHHEDSPDEQHRLIEAAEEEGIGSGMRDRGLSPTVFYETSSPPPGSAPTASLRSSISSMFTPSNPSKEIDFRMQSRGLSPPVFCKTPSPPPKLAPTVSLRSSISSVLTPFSPSTLSIAPNGRLIRRPKRAGQTAAPSTENTPILRHPFMSGALGYDINRPPRSSSSPVPDVPITEHSPETGTQSNEETHDHPIISSPNLTETDDLPSDHCVDTRDALRPFKRNRDEAPLENKERRPKRLRFQKDMYALPRSPQLGYDWKKTFSTATTAVNSKPGSPNESTPMYIRNLTQYGIRADARRSDYERTVQITIDNIEDPVSITCHEHLFLEVSGLHDSLCFKVKDDMITLYPAEKIPHINARTVELFVHWLYYGRFTDPGEKGCGFRQLLELYYLGQAYAMTVLQNAVIDQLISRFIEYDIPTGCTKKLYTFTPSDDQLRRLWVDFYVWEVPEKQFLAEMKLDKLHPLFVQDLAVAQMDNIRAMQVALTNGKPLPLVAPYLKARSAYHTRDTITDTCCHRELNEGEGYFHTMDECSQHVRYEKGDASLRARLEKFRLKFERIDIENLDLKRQLRKIQEKVELLMCNMGSKVREHDFIDHRKLFRSYNFDYPEGRFVDHKERVSNDCISNRTSMRGKLVDKLGI